MIHWKTVVHMIISNVSWSGNNTTRSASRDIVKFTILKHFKVDIHPPKAPLIKEVM